LCGREEDSNNRKPLSKGVIIGMHEGFGYDNALHPIATNRKKFKITVARGRN
jgi:hypothetical protein